MTPCEQFDDRLREALDAELSGSRLDEFDAHLENCETCGAILNNSVQTKAMLKAAYDHPWDELPKLTEAQIHAIVAAMRRAAADDENSSSMLVA